MNSDIGLATKRGHPPGSSLAWRCIGVALAFALSCPGAAIAQNWDWLIGPSSPSSTPTPASFLDGYLSYAIGGWVQLVTSADVPPDVKPVNPPFAAGVVRRRPMLAALLDPNAGEEKPFIFVSGAGYVYKLDVPSLQLRQSRDMRRAGCAADSLIAEPVIQRLADSNSKFTLGKDIVLVATAHACGDTTQNQIVALDANNLNLPPLWVFNTGEYEIGNIHACLLDLERNRIYCAADRPSGSTQNGLWSIDTNTGLLVWAAILDAGVVSRPALGIPGGPGTGHLYVGDTLGRVHAFEANDGTHVATALLAGAADGSSVSITRDLAVGSDAFAGMVFAVSQGGQLVAWYDIGDDLIESWRSSFAGGQYVVAEAVPISSLGKLYVALSDGRFHQLSMVSGSDEANGGWGVHTTVPTMALSAYRGRDGIHRFVGSVYSPSLGTSTLQYRVPCAYASSDCTFAGSGTIPGRLSLKSAVVAGCKSVTGTVTLDKPAPQSIVVGLGDSLDSAITPASLTIPAAATSGSFKIKTSPVNNVVNGQIFATLGIETLGQPLTLRPIGIASMTLDPASVVGSNMVVGNAQLECMAGPGAITVEIASSNPSVATPVPASLVVPQGSQSATFDIKTTAVTKASTAQIIASANGTSKSKALKVLPPASMSPTSLKFGDQVVGTVSAVLNTTLTNNGTQPIAVAGVELTGANAQYYTQSNNCPANLGAGAACTIGVRFSPQVLGTKSAKLSIAISATTAPLLVSLNGTGIASIR